MKVQEDGPAIFEFADAEEEKLFELLNLQLESDLDFDKNQHYEVIYLIHEDCVEEIPKVISKVEGMTTGTPIHVFVPNTCQRGSDYSEMAIAYKLAQNKFLCSIKCTVIEGVIDNETVTLKQVESNIVRCPDPKYAEKMINTVDDVQKRGDTVGGVVICIVRNVPRGLGLPVFDKLEANLAQACMSLPASIGFEFGSGFTGAFLIGSEHNDEFYTDEHGKIRTRTNRSSEIQECAANEENHFLQKVAEMLASSNTRKKKLAIVLDAFISLDFP